MKEDKLVKIAKERFIKLGSQDVHFSGDKECDLFLNNLNAYPHAYVLACLMDRQIKAERAWKIPFIVCEKFGTKNLNELSEINIFHFLNQRNFIVSIMIWRKYFMKAF